MCTYTVIVNHDDWLTVIVVQTVRLHVQQSA